MRCNFEALVGAAQILRIANLGASCVLFRMTSGVASDSESLFVRVAVLDDHRAFAEALSMALNATDDLRCVGIAGSMDGCLELAVTTAPDVIVIDYRLLDGDGLDCAERLQQAGVLSAFVMLTAHASTDLAKRALAAGISTFLPKDSPLADVLSAIRTADEDRATVGAGGGDSSTLLSRRQREVLELMGDGLGPAAIATELFISIHTVRGHLKDILKLLGASTQLEAVTVALRRGYLIPPRLDHDAEA